METSLTSYVKGECRDMCPLAERKLRQRERLVHILEASPEFKPESERMVKSFARPAAGKLMNDPKNLRTPETLTKTVNYLILEIVPNKKLPRHATYDFVMDRLRAVRQDMVIQNMPIVSSIFILQPAVKFYAYAAYSLCEERSFDAHINRTHLQECLKRLLYLYDECDRTFDGRSDTEQASFMKTLEPIRPSFEAMYLVLNLGSPIPLMRVLKLPKILRTNVVTVAFSISLNYIRNNFVRVCRTFHMLPTILKGLAAIHLPEIRRQTFKIMSVAFDSKNLGYPLNQLKALYLYDTQETLVHDLKNYGLRVDEKNAYFKRTDYVESTTLIPPKRLQFIDEEFIQADIPKLILN